MSVYAHYSTLLGTILDALVAEGALPADLNRNNVAVEPPRDASHGDLATNAAMVLAKAAGTNPRALASLIAPKLEALPGITSVEIAGPGFIVAQFIGAGLAALTVRWLFDHQGDEAMPLR